MSGEDEVGGRETLDAHQPALDALGQKARLGAATGGADIEAALGALDQTMAGVQQAIAAATGDPDFAAAFAAARARLGAATGGADFEAAFGGMAGWPEFKVKLDALDQTMAGVQQAIAAATGGAGFKTAIGVRYPERVVMYLEEGSREVLDELAAADHLSLGAYLRRLVMAHVERERRGPGA